MDSTTEKGKDMAISNLYKSRRTVARTRWGRRQTGNNADTVMGVVPIPPGATIRSIDLSALMVSVADVQMEKAIEMTMHGFLLKSIQANHGYGQTVGSYDNMWDDMVPKDRDVDHSLDEYPDDSIADDNQQAILGNSGNIEGGAYDSGAGGGSLNVGTILNAYSGPECVFSRVKRLDVSNGIISAEGKFRAVDKIQTTLNKNYHCSPDAYWWLLFAMGNPKFETVSDVSYHPNTDQEWNQLAFPEITALEGLMSHNDGESSIEVGAFFAKHLENAYIEADTFEDLGGNDGGQEMCLYNQLTVQYDRPYIPGIRANSRDGLG